MLAQLYEIDFISNSNEVSNRGLNLNVPKHSSWPPTHTIMPMIGAQTASIPIKCDFLIHSVHSLHSVPTPNIPYHNKNSRLQ